MTTNSRSDVLKKTCVVVAAIGMGAGLSTMFSRRMGRLQLEPETEVVPGVLPTVPQRAEHHVLGDICLPEAEAAYWRKFINISPIQDDVPSRWREPDVNFGFTLIEDSRVSDLAQDAIVDELAKYDKDCLLQFFARINVVKSFSMYGKETLGTQERGILWIAFSPEQVDDFAEARRAIHFEIACGVFDMRSVEFPSREWLAACPDGFVYPEESVEWANRGARTTVNWDLAKQGFLYEYGMSAMQKDIASVHEIMMISRSTMCDIASRFPPIRRKLDLWTSFARDQGFLR